VEMSARIPQLAMSRPVPRQMMFAGRLFSEERK
jgi:hypothetical protein